MSAEVESNKEEVKPVPKRNFRHKIVNQWQVGIKVVELILAVICMVFIYDPINRTGVGNTNLHHVGVMYTTYTGSMVIIIGFLIGRLLKDRLGYRTSFLFSTVNAALYLATGILLAADRTDLTKDHFYHPSRYLLNMMNTSIIATFLNAIIFIGDAIATFIHKKDF